MLADYGPWPWAGYSTSDAHLSGRRDKIKRWTQLAQDGHTAEMVEALLVEHYDPVYLRSMGTNFRAFADAPRLEPGNAEVAMQGFIEDDSEGFKPGAVTKRNAWHVCAWRLSLAIQSHFPASNYGEDWAFAAPLNAIPGLREVHVPKVLHFYRHSSETTEAPPPG